MIKCNKLAEFYSLIFILLNFTSENHILSKEVYICYHSIMGGLQSAFHLRPPLCPHTAEAVPESVLSSTFYQTSRKEKIEMHNSNEH